MNLLQTPKITKRKEGNDPEAASGVGVIEIVIVNVNGKEETDPEVEIASGNEVKEVVRVKEVSIIIATNNCTFQKKRNIMK